MDQLGINAMWEERILHALDSRGLEWGLTSFVWRPTGVLK